MKLKASITVETALVLPIVFMSMVAVLAITLFLYQGAVSQAIMNMNAQYGANMVTGIMDGRGRLRENRGYIESKYRMSVAYKAYDPAVYNKVPELFKIYTEYEPTPYVEKSDMIKLSEKNLKIINMLDIHADKFYLFSGNSAIIRGTAVERLLSRTGSFSVKASKDVSGLANLIYPSKYIRETDSRSAVMGAWHTIKDDEMDRFLSIYIAELLTRGRWTGNKVAYE